MTRRNVLHVTLTVMIDQGYPTPALVASWLLLPAWAHELDLLFEGGQSENWED